RSIAARRSWCAARRSSSVTGGAGGGGGGSGAGGGSGSTAGSGGGSASVSPPSQANGRADAPWSRRALDDIRLPGGGPRHDEPLFLELPRDGDHLLLRLLDLAQADGAEHLHLFLQHLAGAPRHVAEEALADLLGRAL